MDTIAQNKIQQTQDLLKYEVQKAIDYIEFKRSQTITRLKHSLKEDVENAYRVASGIHQAYQSTHSKAQIINMIKEALRQPRFFDGRGYFFINKGSQSILHPIRPEMEGSDFFDLTEDPNNFAFVNEFETLVHTQGEGYVEYRFFGLEDPSELVPKIGYLKFFEPYGLYIGLSEYVQKFEEKIQFEIFDRLRAVRFGADGYLFIDNFAGEILMHPMKPEIVGKNLIDYQDQNGIYVIQKLIEAAKTKGGEFVYYNWNRPDNTEMEFNKVSFAMGVSDWQWMIGGGIYLDDMFKDVERQKASFKQEVIEEVLFMLVFMACLLLVIHFGLRWWLKQTNRSLQELTAFFTSSDMGEVKSLDASKMFFRELSQLASLINEALSARRQALLNLKQAHKQLQEQANRDYLTGLYNRRFFMDLSPQLIARAQRDQTSFFVLMMDIDYFKQINDSFGHDAGDLALKQFAAHLKQTLRKNDLIVRFGGEEFVAVLIGEHLESEVMLAEKIRQQIEQLELEYKTHTIRYTVSIGVAERAPKEDSIETVLKRADMALYKAKESGRNQVIACQQTAHGDGTYLDAQLRCID